MAPHIDRELGHQLDALRARLLHMAGLVENMIGDAVRALEEGDVELAKATILRDHEVNRDEVDTDELCLLIMARWQPVAGDLRFLTIALKMVTDLERIGDLAVNICERAIDLAGHTHRFDLRNLDEMTRITRSMVHESVDAFVQADVELAQRIIDRDDEVDALYVLSFQDMLQVMRAHPEELMAGVHTLSVVKWLERIADHATNLAELVIFMVKGKDIRHMAPQRRLELTEERTG